MQKLQTNSGVSLVTVMVGIALLGIVSMVVSSLVKNSSISQQSLELQMDQLAIRRLVLTATDCSRTVTGGPYAPNSYIGLVKPDGATFVNSYTADASATKYGKLLVRAIIKSCATCANGKGIFIDAKIASGGGFTTKFKNWTDVNNGATLPCVVR